MKAMEGYIHNMSSIMQSRMQSESLWRKSHLEWTQHPLETFRMPSM
jgi:hypothetical protein